MLQSAISSVEAPARWQGEASEQRAPAAEASNASSHAECGATACSLTASERDSRRRRELVSPCPSWKRAMDIAGASISLVILLPVYLVVALFIKCVSRGPVLYRQRRYGLNGQPFKVWKFRTIEVNHGVGEHRSHVADLMASGRPLEKRDHQLDVIPGGGWLRKFGIDELPQLINVLKGEMSLVGPRPDVVPYSDYASRHRRRFEVLPGITGLWQVSGKNRTTFAKMMQLDLAYVRRRSFWFDVSILLLTIPALAWD